jgi:Rrf2 family transcriptional regulator, cysteine metabolism repressor
VRVSAKAEYACVAMVELAARTGENQPVQIKTIAEGHGISPRFLVQILLQLKGAGLVASSRGSAGGYQLARSPKEIRLADIINIIDRSPQGHSALTSLPQSLVVQAIHEVWQEVTAEEQRILEQTTLADLVQRTQPGDVASYQI